VGTAYIGLFDHAFARQTGGRVVLRIEDTDRERSTRESEEAIIRSLHWVGLQWDEGPDVGGPYGPYRQSERRHIYARHAEELLKKGAVYRCFCTPEQLEQRRKSQRVKGASQGYDRLCRGLSPEQMEQRLGQRLAFVLRLKVPLDGETRFDDVVRGPVSFRNSEIEDVVLLKSDGFPTYHLANVVDDHLMEISHVIRAEEWISSTPKHMLLYEAFGWKPPVFIHMPLLRNRDRSKISKRKNPTSILWYREQGFLPEALCNFLALMGWSMGQDREIFSLQEMAGNFSWERVKTSEPVFDLQKLEWMNGEYIRALSPQELVQRILQEPYTRHTDAPAAMLLEIAKLAQERLKRLAQFDELTAFFFEREPYEAATLVPRKHDAAFAKAALAASRERLGALENWQTAQLEAAMRSLADQNNWKPAALYMVLRVAVTCRTVSTPLFETMQILGKRECTDRIELAAQKAAQLA
jgi:glutamyl-tRNA synthetase